MKATTFVRCGQKQLRCAVFLGNITLSDRSRPAVDKDTAMDFSVGDGAPVLLSEQFGLSSVNAAREIAAPHAIPLEAAASSQQDLHITASMNEVVICPVPTATASANAEVVSELIQIAQNVSEPSLGT